jgi:DNA-binding transcriptional regulator YiaG
MATNRKRTGRKPALSKRTVQPVTDSSVRTVRERLGLTRREFARLVGFSERAIADWESGKPASDSALRRIKEIDRFRERLSEVVSSEAIPGWLNSANRAFDGLKPIEVIERGEIDRLWDMIYYLESGIAS